ncbi:hypothetical protein [Pseudostreptobacillus hongkongensis]|uniref:hypothetical protein n=1 Tax=Pseudostreptobacillus hongkongensis TaxID=1162717 RepID=UPI00082DB156|nr:hypothetical protein [Pseudostreptobacillus hongkongensis]
MLTEEEVYNGAKRWLRKNGFDVIAGQPARGVDHLPVIEIKNPTGDKGSKYAYKPDLVAYKDNIFYIIECKPGYDSDDNSKINDVLVSETRLKSFYTEIEQYKLFDRIGYHPTFDTFKNSIEGVLAYSGNPGPLCNLHKLIVETWQGKASWS